MDQATGTTLVVAGIIAAITPLINLLYSMYEKSKAAAWRHQADLHAQRMELLGLEAAEKAKEAVKKADNLKDVVIQAGVDRGASLVSLGETISAKIVEQSNKIDANTAVNEKALANGHSSGINRELASPVAETPIPVAVTNFPDPNQ